MAKEEKSQEVLQEGPSEKPQVKQEEAPQQAPQQASNETPNEAPEVIKETPQQAPSETPQKKKRRWPLRVLVGLLVAVVVCCGGFAVYAIVGTYPAGETARAELAAWEAGDAAKAQLAAREATDAAGGTDGSDGTDGAGGTGGAAGAAAGSATSSSMRIAAESSSAITVGSSQSEYGLVLYPGAQVDPVAYVPLACKLADQGVYCVIAKMPLNYAFFNINAATDLMATAPSVQHWWLAGHSLGGAMGAIYAADNADKLEGIALLAAFSTSDLSSTGLKVLSVYGSQDGVLSRSSLEKYAGNLPADTQTVVVEGGNHAGIADYGPQAGDGEASISPDEQQTQTASAIVAAMR